LAVYEYYGFVPTKEVKDVFYSEDNQVSPTE